MVTNLLKNNMKNRILILISCVVSFITKAQIDNQIQYRTEIGTYIIPGSPIQMNINDPGINPLRYKINSSTLQVTWTIDELFLLGGTASNDVFSDYSIQGNLICYSGATIVDQQSISLTIDSDNALALFNLDISDLQNTSPVTMVELNNISISTPVINPNLSSSEQSKILNYIDYHRKLQLIYKCEYGIDVRVEGLGTIQMGNSPTISSFGGSQLNSRIQNFAWNTNLNYPNYEIQILQIKNTDPLKVTDENISGEINWDNALKIETTTDQKNIRLTIAEGTGFYVWRVRPIGNYFDGGFADSRNWGRWSNAFAQGDHVNLSINDLSSLPFVFYLNDPDDDKNWMYSRVIMEENKTGEGIVYANNLLQTVQSQAYSSTDGISLISQTVMDYLGRPSLSTLPVPVANNGLNGYEDQFFLNMDNELYTAKDFDENLNIQDPSMAEQTNSHFKYYSSNNPDETIADAEGYPFSRTIFLSDGSGRVMESSGVGKVHAIGQGQTSKILYATPSDDELIAIFGDEAPQSVNILKTVTIDPNGSAYIAYTTIEGVTIATAMSMLTPANFEQIDNIGDNGILDMVVQNEAVINTYVDQKFINSKVLALEQQTAVTIDYFKSCADGFGGENGCPGGNCNFNVRFVVTNLHTGESLSSEIISLMNATCTTALPATDFIWAGEELSSIPATDQSNIITLPAGNWKIQKIVTSEMDINAAYEISEAQIYLSPLIDIVAGWMSEATSEEALNEFNEKLEELIGHITAGHAEAPSNVDYTDPSYQNSFWTGVRGTYFQGLVTNDDFPDHFVFHPDYSVGYQITDLGGGNIEVNQDQLLFTMNCCEPIGVTIPKKEKYPVCQNIEENWATLTNSDIKFSQVFKELHDEIVGDVTDYTVDWGEAVPGFGEIGSETASYHSFLDDMIYHMLTDQYFTGRAINNSGSWVWESDQTKFVYGSSNPGDPNFIPDYATSGLYGPYYTCDVLYECWYASVKAYYEMKKTPGSFDIYESVNGDTDNDAEVGGDDENDQSISAGFFDNDENAEADQGVLDQLVSWIISRKMKDFSADLNGTGGGSSGAEKMAIQYNIPSIFLECTGYKFAGIIDLPGTTIQNEVNDPIIQNDNYIASKEVVLAEIYNESTDQMELVTPEQFAYQNIKSPVWMFKYYEYDPAITSSGQENGTPNAESGYPELSSIGSLELSNCYHDFSSANVVFCNTDQCDNGGHHNWNAAERYSFYKLIENASEDATLTCSDLNTVALEPYTAIVMQQMIADIFTDATNSCASRADYFKSQITTALLSSGFEIVPCRDDQSPCNYISEAELEIMVQNAVSSCGEYVSVIQVCLENINYNDTYYPHSEVHQCSTIVGGQLCATNERTLELFDPAFHIEEKLARIKTGIFIPYGIASPCPDYTPTVLDFDEENCNELNENYSQEIVAD